jgi:hypothetical protein
MTHLRTDALSLLLDDELPASARQRIEEHLAVCPRCKAAYAGLAQVRLAIHEGQPMACQATCHEDFWQGLRAALKSSADDIWSWVALLPALALAAALLLLRWSVGALWALGGLQRLGLVDDWDRAVAEWIPSGLNSPMLERSLYHNLGWTGRVVSARAAEAWHTTNQVTGDGTTELVIALMLCLLAMITVIMGLLWVVCWDWAPSAPRGKGRL